MRATSTRSCFAHRGTEQDVLATKPVSNGCIAGYHYFSFVCEDLSFSGFRFKMYGESIMKLSRKTFMTWTSRLPEIEADRNTVQHSV